MSCVEVFHQLFFFFPHPDEGGKEKGVGAIERRIKEDEWFECLQQDLEKIMNGKESDLFPSYKNTNCQL